MRGLFINYLELACACTRPSSSDSNASSVIMGGGGATSASAGQNERTCQAISLGRRATAASKASGLARLRIDSDWSRRNALGLRLAQWPWLVCGLQWCTGPCSTDNLLAWRAYCFSPQSRATDEAARVRKSRPVKPVLQPKKKRAGRTVQLDAIDATQKTIGKIPMAV